LQAASLGYAAIDSSIPAAAFETAKLRIMTAAGGTRLARSSGLRLIQLVSRGSDGWRSRLAQRRPRIDAVDGSPPPRTCKLSQRWRRAVTIGLDIAKSVFQVHGIDEERYRRDPVAGPAHGRRATRPDGRPLIADEIIYHDHVTGRIGANVATVSSGKVSSRLSRRAHARSLKPTHLGAEANQSFHSPPAVRSSPPAIGMQRWSWSAAVAGTPSYRSTKPSEHRDRRK
jgi:hypothetical protein